MKSPIKIHGGKRYLAPRLAKMLPEHTRYVEPFFGGGSLLFYRKASGVSEYANDLNGALVSFWRALREPGPFEALRLMLEATEFGEPVFREARAVLDEPCANRVRVAWAVMVVSRMSRQGLGRDYATPTSRLRRGVNEHVSAWLGAVAGLDAAHERLRCVEVWNRPAVECIAKLDDPATAFYCDPPYMAETRETNGEYRAYEMSDAQHEELLRTLACVRGKFLLSGYRSSLYDDFAGRYGWRRVEFKLDCKASSKREKDVRTECVWMNY